MAVLVAPAEHSFCFLAAAAFGESASNSGVRRDEPGSGEDRRCSVG